MQKEERKQVAYDCFKQGYNCAESVAIAFEDVVGLERQLLVKMSVGFGGGFGRTRNLCGAVSSMGLVLGLVSNQGDDPQADKTIVYKQIQQVVGQFKERNTSDNCGELLKNIKSVTAGYVPQVRDEQYYAQRPCLKFVLDSVEILSDFLEEMHK
ncbi:MAG: C-GCAxxG-C-C family protein [Clostridia bacterium]